MFWEMFSLFCCFLNKIQNTLKIAGNSAIIVFQPYFSFFSLFYVDYGMNPDLVFIPFVNGSYWD